MYSLADTGARRNMHEISILQRTQHARNAAKAPEGYSVQHVSETTSVNMTDTMVKDIDIVTSHLPDCDDISAETNRIDQMKEKMKQLKRQLRKKTRIIKEMKTQHTKYKKALQLKLRLLQKEARKTNSLPQVVSKLFNDDQVKFLTGKTIAKWSNDTLLQSYRLKFACGTSGYTELLRQQPSLRILNRRLEELQFKSGLIDDIFYFLRIKMAQFENDIDKDCMLVLDEMSIVADNIYDNATKEMLNQLTLPDHSGEADEGLVFLIARLASRWKQIIAYYFTNKRTCGRTYKPIIIEIINKCEQIG